MIADTARVPATGLGNFKDKLLSSPRSPLLSHLNADTSWLLSLPYPENEAAPPTRTRFNILIDPWFTGKQSDVAAWFSTQYHAVPSSIQTVATLNTVLAEAENATLPSLLSPSTSNCSSSSSGPTTKPSTTTHIDLVLISHEFTDHCHRATLLELPQSTPIFTTPKAAHLISTWNHFTTIISLSPFLPTTDYRTLTHPPHTPPWLSLAKLTTPNNSLYYHAALLILTPTSSSSSSSPSASATIYTPHGIAASTLSSLTTAHPPIETLCFLHGLHDVSITLSKQLNLGAHNAFQAQRVLKPKYWVGTHDEVKKGLGLIGPLLRRKVWTVEDAVRRDRERRSVVGDGVGGSEKEREEEEQKVPFVECGNGETLVLA